MILCPVDPEVKEMFEQKPSIFLDGYSNFPNQTSIRTDQTRSETVFRLQSDKSGIPGYCHGMLPRVLSSDKSAF
jgi:hypothetical protein